MEQSQDTTLPDILFKDWACRPIFRVYGVNDHGQNAIAIELAQVETYEPIARATVNMPHAEMGHREILIKDYSENEGMVASFLAAGYINEPDEALNAGWVEGGVHRCTLTDLGAAEALRQLGAHPILQPRSQEELDALEEDADREMGDERNA